MQYGHPVGGCGIWPIMLRTLNWITNPVAVLDIILYKKVFRIEIESIKTTGRRIDRTPIVKLKSVPEQILIYTKLQPPSRLVCALRTEQNDENDNQPRSSIVF